MFLFVIYYGILHYVRYKLLQLLSFCNLFGRQRILCKIRWTVINWLLIILLMINERIFV